MTSQQVVVKYKKYPKSKPSGNEWLEDIPEGWNINRLKHLSYTRVSNVDKKSEDDVAVRLCNYVDVYKNEFVIEAIDFMPATATARQIDEFRLQYGDVIITKDSETPDDIGVPAFVSLKDNKNVVCGYHLAIITPRSDVLLGRYLFRLLESTNYRSYYEVSCHGVTRFGLDAYSILNTEIALPSIPEQIAIADFLDRKTALIDDVIAKKQKLIELLKEKRHALITHAVTKGLDLKAMFKPSGIDWLGDIPAEWEVKKLKYLCSIQTGDKDTVDAVDDGDVPFFVRSQTVERINSYTFDCEAVLTAGDGVGVGKVFHYVNGKFDFHQRVYMFNKFRKVTGLFFFHFLKENFYKVAFDGSAKSTVDSLRMPMLADFWIAFPPVSQQQIITDFIDRETAKIDEVMNRVESQIGKLQEYRQALITSAVTGKIKVVP